MKHTTKIKKVIPARRTDSDRAIHEAQVKI